MIKFHLAMANDGSHFLQMTPHGIERMGGLCAIAFHWGIPLLNRGVVGSALNEWLMLVEILQDFWHLDQ